MAPCQQVQPHILQVGAVFAEQRNQHARHPCSLPPAASELAKLLGNRTRALMAFEDPEFEPGAFMATFLGQLGEKAIDNARRDLGALLATCTEEVGACLVRARS
jgi:Zn-dependent oligopeptidase